MRFSLYHFVSGVLQVLAWLTLVLCVVFAIIVVASPYNGWYTYYGSGMMEPMGPGAMAGMRWVLFVGLLIGGIASWAGLLAMAGILQLLISIDENTHPRAFSATAPGAVPGLKCPACGAPIKPGDRFCQSCGAKLE